LGLGGMRSFEKSKGVARENMKKWQNFTWVYTIFLPLWLTTFGTDTFVLWRTERENCNGYR